MLGPNFDASPYGFQINWPIWLLLSQPRFFVAASIVSATSQWILFGRDLPLTSLGSDVATAR